MVEVQKILDNKWCAEIQGESFIACLVFIYQERIRRPTAKLPIKFKAWKGYGKFATDGNIKFRSASENEN